MSAQTRQPAGTPTGGQFAASARTETSVTLTPPGPAGQVRDELAMDRIALRMGSQEEWDTGELTSQVAAELAATGRPAVDDRDPEDFLAELNAYVAARPGPVTETARQLDGIAWTMGTSSDWSSDTTEEIARAVQASGRPDPGDADPDEYIALIANARAARASTFEDAQAEIAEGLANYLDRQAYNGELAVDVDGFTAHVVEGEDGKPRYSRTITVRGKGNTDEGLDVTGTPAEGLLDDLARYPPLVDRLDEVTR